MTERIDLMQEFVGLFNQEEMVAFFDFTFALGDTATQGLCRVSKPKSSAMPYLSLSFMVDSPTKELRSRIDAQLERLEGNGLQQQAPMISSVVSMPVDSGRSESYVRQLDVMLEERVDPGRFFIEQRLVPALQAVAGLNPGEIVWWGDLADEAELAATKASSEVASEEGITTKLKRLLSRH